MKPSPVLRLVGPARGLLVAAVLLQAAASAVSIVPLIALVHFAIAGPDGAPAVPIALAAGSALAGVLLAFLATSLSHRADAIVQLDVRRRLIARFSDLPLGWFAEQGPGRIKKLVHDDVASIHYLVAHTALDVTAIVAGVLAGVTYLTVHDWRLALAASVLLLAGAAFFWLAMRGSRERFATYAKAQGDINAAIVDYVQGIAVAKSFGGAHGAQAAFTRAVDGFHDFFRGWSRATTPATTASWLVVTPALTLTLFAALSLSGDWARTDVIALALAGPAVAAPVAVIGPRLQALRTGASAAASIAAVLDLPPLRWGDGAREPAGAEVTFEEVSFGYRPGEPVIHDLTVTLAEGTLTALVGPSGAGKSTLAGLLARFHDPGSGAVRIGGVDLRELTAPQLYRHVSFVFQDVALLEGTIRDNITGGAPLDEESVVRAARAACIHDRVMATPHGYDTVIGEGVELSGGEAQRLSIARALVRDTPIVVLDEPTAAADPQTQAALQTALSALVRGRTVLVIAHRLHTVTGADQILVMDGGRVVERGTHPGLLAAGGRYTRLWTAQTHQEGART